MTIQKPHITELRYVNGEPDPNLRPDQQRITWAKNGEPSTGASSDTTSDGVLNRAGVQIQENTITSHNNTKSQQAAIENLVDAVNMLTGSDDADFGERLDDVETDVEILQTKTADLETKVGQDEDNSVPDQPQPATGLFARIDAVKKDVGVRNPLDVENPLAKNDTVRDDLFFIKQRLGNERGYDWNGNVVPGGRNPTGIYLNVEDLYSRVNTVSQEIGADDVTGSVKGRITDLENNSSVGDVSDIRSEIGPRNDRDPARNIYLRLDDAESALEDNTIDITSLKTDVQDPTTGTKVRVTTLETTVGAHDSAIQVNAGDIASIGSDIGVYDSQDPYAGTMKARLSVHSEDIAAIWGRIGYDDIAGGTLGYRVKELEQDIGDKANPVSGTVWYDLNTVTAQYPTLISDVSNLKSVVGSSDNEQGTLRYRVADVENRVGNENQVGNGFTLQDDAVINWYLAGIAKPILSASQSNVEVNVGDAGYDLNLYGAGLYFNGDEMLMDAPADGQQYARRNNAWEIVSGGSGGTDPALGFTLGTTSTIRFDNDDFSVRNVISNAADVTTFGEAGYKQRFVGEVTEFIIDNDSKLTAIDSLAASKNVIGLTSTDVLEVGDATVGMKLFAPSFVQAEIEFGDNPGVGHALIHEGNVDAFLPTSPEDGFIIGQGNAISGTNSGGDIELIQATDDGAVIGSSTADTIVDGTKTKLRASTSANLVVETADDMGNEKEVIHSGNVGTYAPTLAPLDGSTYALQGSSWVEILGSIGNRTNTTYINTVSDFETVGINTIELKDNTTYIISGSVDIGDRKFVHDSAVESSNVSIIGGNPLTSKLISTTEDPLFDCEAVSLFIQGIGISTHGEVFNLVNTKTLAFAYLHEFNVDNAIGLGQVLGYNQFAWSGDSLVSYLWGDATECDLLFGETQRLDINGDPTGIFNEVDIVTMDVVSVHSWQGPLINFSTPGKQVRIAIDAKISNQTQKILADTVTDSSIATDGIGKIEGSSVRIHHELGSVLPPYDRVTHTPDWNGTYLDDVDATIFNQMVRDSVFLGGVQSSAVHWNIVNCINLHSSVHSASIDMQTQQTITLTSARQNIFATLTGETVKTSQYSWDSTNSRLVEESFVIEPRSLLWGVTMLYTGAETSVNVIIETEVIDLDGTTRTITLPRVVRQNQITTLSLLDDIETYKGSHVTCYIKHDGAVSDFQIEIDSVQLTLR